MIVDEFVSDIVEEGVGNFVGVNEFSSVDECVSVSQSEGEFGVAVVLREIDGSGLRETEAVTIALDVLVGCGVLDFTAVTVGERDNVIRPVPVCE